jgi:hypothetical protein
MDEHLTTTWALWNRLLRDSEARVRRAIEETTESDWVDGEIRNARIKIREAIAFLTQASLLCTNRRHAAVSTCEKWPDDEFPTIVEEIAERRTINTEADHRT